MAKSKGTDFDREIRDAQEWIDYAKDVDDLQLITAWEHIKRQWEWMRGDEKVICEKCEKGDSHYCKQDDGSYAWVGEYEYKGGTG